MKEEKVYHIGHTRENKSITQLFLDLRNDEEPKTIYIDAGVYDIFREYKKANIPSPPDDVSISDYFDYNAFLPPCTRLIGVGNVTLLFAPNVDEITYGESITWSPLNILGECYVENIEIRCKNGRYCIHDDSHCAYPNTVHYYKHVRCFYELGDLCGERRLGVNHTVGNGMAQGCRFEFEDCSFEFCGDCEHSAFYTHECGYDNPANSPTLIFKHCIFLAGEDNDRVMILQNLAGIDLHVYTRIESCYLSGGVYLTVYSDNSAQHYDVTLIGSGSPQVLIDRAGENRYPVKVYNM